MWFIRYGMGARETKTVRVSVPITLDLLQQVDALIGLAPAREVTSRSELLKEALERGVALLEVDSRARQREVEARRLAVESGVLSEEEARRVVQREGRLAFGTRETPDDRRDEGRGLVAGRRETDRRHARRVFVQRVIDLVEGGMAYGEVADLLNEEKLTTSRGQPWSGSSIGQVFRTDREKRARTAWRPRSLT